MLSGKVDQNREVWLVGRENKAERCVKWEARANQRDVVSGKGEQNREMG